MDGLDFYRHLIPGCAVLLAKQGLVALEIGDGQAGAVSQIFDSSGSYEEVLVVRDHAGKERVVIGKKGE
jgi:release factor glutamine methyltransferase